MVPGGSAAFRKDLLFHCEETLPGYAVAYPKAVFRRANNA